MPPCDFSPKNIFRSLNERQTLSLMSGIFSYSSIFTVRMSAAIAKRISPDLNRAKNIKQPTMNLPIGSV